MLDTLSVNDTLPLCFYTPYVEIGDLYGSISPSPFIRVLYNCPTTSNIPEYYLLHKLDLHFLLNISSVTYST